MRERALLVGGALAVKDAGEGGVEVRLEVPTEEL
jgi:signal transduction histidine kinase